MKTQNRWVILVASIVANLCIGAVYAWSVYQKPLIDMFGFSTSEANLAYTLSLCVVPFAMMVSGKLQEIRGARFTLMFGGILFGAGILAAGLTSGIAMLYITYGVLGGVGIGLVYGCTVPNTVKWFPDKRGMAGGVIAAGLGLGSVLVAPLSAFLIVKTDVLATFRVEGIAFIIIIVVASLFVTAPPAGYKPAGWNPPEQAAGGNALGYTPGGMVKTAKFWVIWLMYAVGCMAGLMIIGHASPIGQEQIMITPEVAAGAVALLSIANTGGRLLWGFISDKIGRYNALILMYILTGVMLLLLSNAGSYWVFVVAIMGVGLSYGGFLGVFPSITADYFGAQHLGINYGVMFTAFGLAAFIGPSLGATIREASGDYSMAFIIASCLSIAGVLLALYTKWSLKRSRNN